MNSNENEGKKKGLSGIAVISFVVSLALCSVLIRIAIINRNNVEQLKIEQLVLEKTLRISEVISKLHYKTQALSIVLVQEMDGADRFSRMAYSMMEEDPAIIGVFLAPDGIVSDVFPSEGNGAFLGTDLLADEASWKEGIVNADNFLFRGPFDLPQGGKALSASIPVYSEIPVGTKVFWGFISVILKVPEVFKDAELGTINTEGFSYELFRIELGTGEKLVITDSVEHAGMESRFMENAIQVHNADWYLRVFPVRAWHSYPENLALIIAGFFLSFLIFFIMQNNFELRRMRGVFETMAKMDVLTGIYNRRYIEENLKKVINTISRSSGEITLLMIDVDFFKRYNDTYGHGKGDGCLKAIAGVFAQSLFREEDFVARYGGEEFVVVLPNCSERGAHKAAGRILQNIRDCNIPHEKNEPVGIVTISIGVTTGKAEHTRSGDEYLKKADEALYMSKHDGRNMYTFLPFP